MGEIVFFLEEPSAEAMLQALQINQLAAKQHRAKFRSPDALANASQELEKLTNYRYQKIAGSRAIEPWTYLLIPHDQIHDQMTLRGLAARCTVPA